MDSSSPQVERTRHVILLREKLAEHDKAQELSKLDKEIVNRQAKVCNNNNNNSF